MNSLKEIEKCENKTWKENTLKTSSEMIPNFFNNQESLSNCECAMVKPIIHKEMNLIDANANEMLPSDRSSPINIDENLNLCSLTTSNDCLTKLEAIQKWYDSKLLECGIKRTTEMDKNWDIPEEQNDSYCSTWEYEMKWNASNDATESLDETRDSESFLLPFARSRELIPEYQMDEKTNSKDSRIYSKEEFNANEVTSQDSTNSSASENVTNAFSSGFYSLLFVIFTIFVFYRMIK
ncbi:hypothetical protein ACH3XW_19580 [Acanthocheilonema viteae]